MTTANWLVGLGMAFLAAGSPCAQEGVPGLQDLIGARGSSGEQALEKRGYHWVRTEKSGDAAYSYWQESENGQCVTVRTENGRYASIVTAPAADCAKGDDHAAATDAASGSFQTVCGVMTGGKTYRYRCKAEDQVQGGRKVSTTLHYPDQTLKLVWKSGKQVELHFEGMVPQTAHYATAEGETNFQFEDKTYFYISNRDLARDEVEHFQD